MEITMSLMKFFFSHQVPQSHVGADPLQHPALAAMSLTELADLPLMPENLGRTIVSPTSEQSLIRPSATFSPLSGRRLG
jgi:hypothetical protein